MCNGLSPTNGFCSRIHVLAFSIRNVRFLTEFNLIILVERRRVRGLESVFFSFFFFSIWGGSGRLEFLGLVSFIRCSVLSSLWLRWRWSGNQWVTRFFLSLWKSELFSSQCCRFRQRILANLDPSRGLLIGSRELLWKLCSIEMRRFAAMIPSIIFQSINYSLAIFLKFLFGPVDFLRKTFKKFVDRITIFTRWLRLFIRWQHHRLWGVTDLSIVKTFRVLPSWNRKILVKKEIF